MPPKSAAGEDAAPPAADERARKRAKQGDATTAAAAEDASARDSGAAATASTSEQPDDRSALILFLVLESQRHAAREARLAYRLELSAREALDVSPGPRRTLGGEDADDGEGGSVVAGGWWWPPPDYTHRGSREPRVPALAADRSFIETCSAAARVSTAWRSVAFGSADRATLSWAGYDRNSVFQRATPTSRPLRDPVSIVRAFDSGVLRALCLHGEPDDYRRLRAFARALGVAEPATSARSGVGSAEDMRAASVLRGLRVLRLEHAYDLAAMLALLRFCSPLPSPPLFSSLVSLDLARWRSVYKQADSEDCDEGDEDEDEDEDDDEDGENDDGSGSSSSGARSSSSPPPCFFTRSNLPSLRSLSVSLTGDSDCPLDWFNGVAATDPAFLPPLLTRLRVDADGAQEPPPAGLECLMWPRNQPLLASSEFLATLAPSILSLSVGRALATADGGPADDAQGDPTAPRDAEATWDTTNRVRPMARLLPCLGGMTRLTSLELESDYDCSPGDGNDRRAWAQASRALMMPMAATLRRLSLDEALPSTCSFTIQYPSLPPALSLLTALESLEVRAWGLQSAGCLARLTTLKRLLIHIEDDDLEEHGPILGSDLAPLSRLEFLSLSRPEPCWATVFSNNLPRLSTLVTRDFYTRNVGKAMLMRMTRDGVAVWNSVKSYADPPTRLSVADLESLIEKVWGDEQDQIQWHEEEHQAAMQRAASMQAEEAVT